MATVSSESLQYNFSISGRGTHPAVAWRGTRVAVVIELPNDNDTSSSAQHARRALAISSSARARLLECFDTLYSTLEAITLSSGLEAYANGLGGMPVVEAPLEISQNAAGLAHHDVGGISVGAGILAPLCTRFDATDDNEHAPLDHVYFYELGRNFWEPRFNCAFDWYCDNDPSCCGWWTVAMNNVWSIVVPEVADCVEMTYFGRGRSEFRERMLRDIREYVRRARSGHADFEAWKCSRMPWRKNESVNDLMTGLILAMYDAYGGVAWLTEFFAELRTTREVNECTSGGCDYAGARDNFYRICSKAAKKDLVYVFEEQLKWPLSDVAKAEINALYEGEKTRAPLLTC